MSKDIAKGRDYKRLPEIILSAPQAPVAAPAPVVNVKEDALEQLVRATTADVNSKHSEIKKLEKKLNRAKGESAKTALLVQCVNLRAYNVNKLSEQLEKCTAEKNKKLAKITAKSLDAEVKAYNAVATEYSSLVNTNAQTAPAVMTAAAPTVVHVSQARPAPLTKIAEAAPAPVMQADAKMSKAIVKGKSYERLPEMTLPNPKTTDAGRAAAIRAAAEENDSLMQFIRVNTADIDSKKAKLRKIEKKVKRAKGDEEKAALLLQCVNFRAYNVNRLSEQLERCTVSNNAKYTKLTAKTLDTEIKEYNATAEEYTKIALIPVMLADAKAPKTIVSGKPYYKLPEQFSPSANDVVSIAPAPVVIADAKMSKGIVKGKSFEKLSETVLEAPKTTDAARAAADRVAAAEDKLYLQYLRANAADIDSKHSEIKKLEKKLNRAKGEAVRAALLVQCVNLRAYNVNRLSEQLERCACANDVKRRKITAKALETEIKAYNATAEEYTRASLIPVMLADVKMPKTIVSGKPYYKLPEAVTYAARETAPAPGVQPMAVSEFKEEPSVIISEPMPNEFNDGDIARMNQHEFGKFAARKNKEIASYNKQLKSHDKLKCRSVGADKNALIIDCIEDLRCIIGIRCELLENSVHVNNRKAISQNKKLLVSEISRYNKYISEYNLNAKEQIPHASTKMVSLIIKDKPYKKLPKILFKAPEAPVIIGNAEDKSLIKYIRANGVDIGRKHSEAKKLKKKIAHASDKEKKEELLVCCVNLRVYTINKLAEQLERCTLAGNARFIKSTSKALNAEIKAYNAVAEEYTSISLVPIAKADVKMAKAIQSGKYYVKLSDVIITAQKATEDNKADAKVDDSLIQYIRANTADIDSKRSELKKLQKKICRTKDDDRKAELLVRAVNLRAYNVNRLSEQLERCVAEKNSKYRKSTIKALNAEIKAYNAVVDEYTALSGRPVAKADEKMPKAIVRGKSYVKLLPISNLGIAAEKLKENSEATGKSFSDGVRNSVARAAAEERSERQKENALTVITDETEFYLEHLYKKRNSLSFNLDGRFGSTRRISKITKKIRNIVRLTKKAKKQEQLDNTRYYKAVLTDLSTLKLKNESTKDELRKIQDRIVELLNRRDEINIELINHYAGTEEENVKTQRISHREVRFKAERRAFKSLRKVDKDLRTRYEYGAIDSYKAGRIHAAMHDMIEAKGEIAVCIARLKESKKVRLTRHQRETIKKERIAWQKKYKMADQRLRNNIRKDILKHMIPYGIVALVLVAAAVAVLALWPTIKPVIAPWLQMIGIVI